MFFFKQKTAYEMRISDWSSDVCSSDFTHAASDANAFAVAQGALARPTILADPLENGEQFLNIKLRFRIKRDGKLGNQFRIFARELEKLVLVLREARDVGVAPWEQCRAGLGGGRRREIGRGWCRERVCQSG